MWTRLFELFDHIHVCFECLYQIWCVDIINSRASWKTLFCQWYSGWEPIQFLCLYIQVFFRTIMMGMNGMCLTPTLSSVSGSHLWGQPGIASSFHFSDWPYLTTTASSFRLFWFSDFLIFLINLLLNYFFFLIGSMTGKNSSSCNQGVDNSSCLMETLKELMTQYYYFQICLWINQ